MAEKTSGATPWLAFMVGALLVIVAVIGYLMYSGQSVKPDNSFEVSIQAPELPDAPKLPDAPVPTPK
ncbi:MAG: hypothetical protein Q8L66_03965 [Caulobacter sp.]|nr:hypothetical protein [Caulobacter sp.]